MRAILEKISKNKNAIRTEGPIDGFYDDPPTVGKSFEFYSRPLDPKMNIRVITTSPVERITVVAGVEELGILVFQTENSEYMLRIKGEDKEGESE